MSKAQEIIKKIDGSEHNIVRPIKITSFMEGLKWNGFSKYHSIEKEYNCIITERAVLVSNEKHWFAPKSLDDRLWECNYDRDWYSFNGEKIAEGIAPDQMGLDKYLGGTIVFSTDVNAQDLSKNKLVNWFENKYTTFVNRLFRKKKLTKLIKDKFSDVGGFSIGNFFNGRYIEKNTVFNEKSLCIEVLGIPSEILIRLATEIARDFNQSTVLLKDKNTNKNILIDQK
jgi:hypothetical protein